MAKKEREQELNVIWERLGAEIKRMVSEQDQDGTKRDQLIKDIQSYYVNRTWAGDETLVKETKRGLRNAIVEPSD